MLVVDEDDETGWSPGVTFSDSDAVRLRCWVLAWDARRPAKVMIDLSESKFRPAICCVQMT